MNKSITEKYSFIQACNFINLPRTHDFSKFCFKFDKADADILKKYIRTDFENDLVAASSCSYYHRYSQVANTIKRHQRRIQNPVEHL